jgi:fused signal recognition particle receptor
MFGLFQKKTEQGVKRSREAWFSKITRLFDRARVDDSVWEELEELLISADVGVDTTADLIQRVKERVKTEKISDGPKVREVLKQEMVKKLSLDDASSRKIVSSPEVILVAGVNGSGKTTSIAKLANSYKKDGQRVILAAADTFRAAAIEQLQKWGDRIGAEVIAHRQGGDPGAVVFDALEAARSRGVHVVIVDTAGRLHTKFNLMEELKKIKRVASRIDQSAPHQVLLVLDATTGQNGLAQAKYFTEAIGITGIFLAKLDGTAKGGIVLSICDSLKIPILYIGTGEGVEDLAPFNAQAFVEALCST